MPLIEVLVHLCFVSQVSNSKGAIFSEGMKQFSYILAGIVFGIYCIVFAVDFFIRYKTKKNKIGDFRQGMCILINIFVLLDFIIVGKVGTLFCMLTIFSWPKDFWETNSSFLG